MTIEQSCCRKTIRPGSDLLLTAVVYVVKLARDVIGVMAFRGVMEIYASKPYFVTLAQKVNNSIFTTFQEKQKTFYLF